MKPVRFLHIPKTAGSTFTAILNRQYAVGGTFSFSGSFSGDYSDIKRFEALSENEKRDILLFSGHAPIVSGVKAADEATTITFLRNPISRVKSFCQHVSEGKSSHLVKDFPPDNFNLDAFLESGNLELTNFQTRMLVCNPTNLGIPWQLNDALASRLKEEALENLFNKISHFGIQEYFDESLIIFSLAFGWEMPLYVSANTMNTKKRIRFEKRHLERIAELNALDMAVYMCAKERFIYKLASSAFSKEKLRQFQFINKIYKHTVRPRNLFRRLFRFAT